MKKLFLSMALLAAISATAETRVETFDPKDPADHNAATYNTKVTHLNCQLTSWTVLYGGITSKDNPGQLGADNYAAIVRAAKSSEEGYGYLVSDSIEGGIDSLSFTWNSNGDANCDLDIRIYINNDSIGGIYRVDEYKKEAPFYTWSKGNLRQEGKFVIRIENKTISNSTKNKKRLVIDDLTWTTYTAPMPENPTAITDLATAPALVNVYTLDGCLIRSAVAAEQAAKDLENGIYIINNRKVVIAH